MKESINLIGTFLIIVFLGVAILNFKKNKISILNGIGIKLGKNTYIEIVIGILIGFIAMIGIYGLELNFELINFIKINRIDNGLLRVFLLIAFYALFEEVIFRGVMLNGMIAVFRKKYIAVLLTGIIFGLMHAGNPHATSISIISNGIGGVMYSIAFLGSESLWLPFALHFAWNFFQGPMLGFPVSGINFTCIISQNYTVGSELLTGGAYGPEAGIIGIGFRFVVIALLFLYFYLAGSNKNFKDLEKYNVKSNVH